MIPIMQINPILKLFFSRNILLKVNFLLTLTPRGVIRAIGTNDHCYKSTSDNLKALTDNITNIKVITKYANDKNVFLSVNILMEFFLINPLYNTFIVA